MGAGEFEAPYISTDSAGGNIGVNEGLGDERPGVAASWVFQPGTGGRMVGLALTGGKIGFKVDFFVGDATFGAFPLRMAELSIFTMASGSSLNSWVLFSFSLEVAAPFSA